VTAIREEWPAPAASRDTTVAPTLAIEVDEPEPETEVEDEVAEAMACLSQAEQEDLRRLAEEEVKRVNPTVAQYPESEAYKALVRDGLMKRLKA
jgi:hypothetical protein